LGGLCIGDGTDNIYYSRVHTSQSFINIAKF
jgi:hypothetical protein